MGPKLTAARGWVLPLFTLLQRRGEIAEDEMLRAFNMGVGLVACVDGASLARAIDLLKAAGEQPITLGRVVSGDRDVRYVNAP